MGKSDKLGLRWVQSNCDSANLGNCSPHETFHGQPPQSRPIPSLKPRFCKFKRANKIDPKSRECLTWDPQESPAKRKESLDIYGRENMSS